MTDILLAPGFPINLDVLIESRGLIQAQSGGGKSRTLRRIIEQTAPHVQHIVLDPEGEFASLRERFPFVLAARRGGEALADPRTAALLATKLLELRASAVVDIYDLPKSERRRFIRLFCETLVSAPKSLWHPVIVSIDEVQDYAPEKGEAESLSAVVDLAVLGRKRGFCLIGATQRLSMVSKDVAAAIRNIMIGPTGLDIDQKRAADVLGFDKPARQALGRLDSGQFWCYGPALSKLPTLVEVGPVLTSHPKVGERKALPPAPTPAKIKALLPQLADLPAEAEEKARTEADLRRELATARSRITVLEKGQPVREVPKEVEKRVEVNVLKDGQLERAEKLIERVARLAQDVHSGIGAIGALVIQIAEVCQPIAQAIASTKVAAPTRVLSPVERTAPARNWQPTVRPTPAAAPTEGGPSGPQQRILDSLAWWEAIGITTPENAAVAFKARYSPTSTSYTNPRGALSAQGLIEYPSPDRVRLTDAGRKLAIAPTSEPTEDQLQQEVLTLLSGPERRILEPLLRAYPKALTNEDAAAAAGYSSKTSTSYTNPRGHLSSIGLIEYPAPDQVRARSTLFLEGQ